MAKTDYRNIDEYHKAFPKEITGRMQTIRSLVHRVAPEAEEVISYQIPAFKLGRNYLIYYAAFGKHLTLSSPWSKAFLAQFETHLKKYKVSKSAIQFPHDEPLPVDLIAKILEFRKKESVS